MTTQQPFKRVLLVGTVSLLLALGFISITHELFTHGFDFAMDKTLLNHSLELRTLERNVMARDITALGSTTIATLFTLSALLLLGLAQDMCGFWQLAVTASGAGIWTRTLKYLVARERPTLIPHLETVNSFSFPSGHAVASAAIFLGLALLACRHFPSYVARASIITLALGVAMLVALSRVYLGVHYPSDVFGGMLLGLAWALLVARLFQKKAPRSFNSLFFS